MKTTIFTVIYMGMMMLLPSFAQGFVNTLLEFSTMVGVAEPFLGSTNPIRGVNGGGAPWVLESGRGELRTDGNLLIEVTGLIIPESAGQGLNPAPFFRAAVNCMSVDDAGLPVVRTVLTENGSEVMKGDPTNGDARIVARLDLPNPCIAPIVFVTSPTGSWFAASGALTTVEEPGEQVATPQAP